MSDSSDLIDLLVPESVQQVAAAEQGIENAATAAGERTAADARLGLGVDPPYVKVVEAFEGFSHEDIFSKVQSLEPGLLSPSAEIWKAAAARFQTAVEQFEQNVGRAITQGWTGETSEAALKFSASVFTAGDEASGVMNSVASRLSQASDAAGAVKAAVPPPEPPISPVDLASALLIPSRAVDTAAAQRRAEEARQQAIRVMNDVYKPALLPVGDAVPSFTAAPSIGDGSGTGNGNGSGSGRGSGSGGFGGSSSSTNGQGGGDPADTQSAGLDGAGQSQGSVGQGAGATGTGAGSSSTGSPLTSAASAGSDSYGRTGSNAYGGSSTGSGVGGVGGGSIGGRRKDDQKRDTMAGGITGMGMGAIGGGMAGAMLAGNDALRSGASVASGAVAAGKGGMPGGMMPGGRKADGEEDQEHETPTYLINVENGNELIGDIAPAAPPVLGVWDEE